MTDVLAVFRNNCCLIVFLISTSCSINNLSFQEQQRIRLLRQGASFEYAAGFAAGCAEHRQINKNPTCKPSADCRNPEYAVGWEHGYSNCQESSSSMWEELRK